MVQVIQAAPMKQNFWGNVGHNFGEGLGEGMKEKQERDRYDKYRKEEDEELRKRGIELSGIRDPQTRAAIIAHDLQYGKKKRLADVSQESGYPLNERKELPNFMEGASKRNLNRYSPEKEIAPSRDSYGSLYQPETEGGKVKILSPEELWDRSARNAQRKSAMGIPTSVEEEYTKASAINNANQQYNASIQNDKDQAALREETYGNLGESELFKVHKEATPPQAAIFRKYGEDAAKEGMSQSEIRKNLAEKAENFKNILNRIERSIPAPRAASKAQRSILGTTASEIEDRNSIKVQLQPLLDMGLYDTARRLLESKGYGLEEREALISDLPEGARKVLATIPKMEGKTIKTGADYFGRGNSRKRMEGEPKTPNPFQRLFESKEAKEIRLREEEEKKQKNQDLVNDTMLEVFKNDPSTNLVLLRSAYENKNVDWRMFKSAINKGILEGKIKLNGEQMNQLSYLEDPPLDGLDEIMHIFNVKGK